MSKTAPTASLTAQLLITIMGNGVAAGVGFVTVLLITRALSVGEFGQFTVALSFILVTSQLTGLGTTRAMVKFSSALLRSGKTAAAAQVIRVSLSVRSLAALALALVLWWSAGALAARLSLTPGLAPLLELAAIGVVVGSLVACLKSVLYALQRFVSAVGLQLAVDAGKLLLCVLLLASANLDLTGSVAVFAVAPLIGVAGGLWLLRHILATPRDAVPGVVKRLFSFGGWAFLSRASSMALNPVGLFLLAHLAGDHEAGIYGLALNLTFGFSILAKSLSSVLLPSVSRFSTREQLESFFAVSLIRSLSLGGLALPLIVAAVPLIPIVFGERYGGSTAVFIWLAFGAVFLTIGVSARVILHSLDDPRLAALVDLSVLVAMAVGSYALIPRLGVLGPAVTSLVVSVVAFVLLTIAVRRRLARGQLDGLD